MDVFVPALHLGTGGLSLFTVDGQTSLGGGVVGQLTTDGHTIHGQVQNLTGQRISDAALVVGSSVYKLGTIEPNATRPVSMPVPSSEPSDSSPAPLASELAAGGRPSARTSSDPRSDVLDRALASSASGQNGGAPLFVGWLDHAPLTLDVKRARAAVQQYTLLEAGLRLSLDTAAAGSIPSSLLEERPLVSLGVTEAQPGHYSIATGGSLGVEYDLPATNGAVRGLHLQVAGSYSGGADFSAGTNLGSISVFDWTQGDWRTLPLIAGDNALDPAASLVSPTGEVRLRYTFKPPAGSNASGVDFSRFALAVAGAAT
jgi:hypothetical protein